MAYAQRTADGDWSEIVGDFVIDDVQYPAAWPDLVDEESRAAIGIAAIVEGEPPAGVRILGAELYDAQGTPTRRWLTEAIVPQVPTIVSPRQLKLALLGAGLLDDIDAFVAHPSTPRAAQISWEYATEYRRDDPMLNAMAQQLQPPLTGAQIDQLFIAAAAIE